MTIDQERVLCYLKKIGEILCETLVLIGISIYVYGEKLYRLFVPRSLKSLEGEIILLTGSGNGIGKQIALQLAPLGATVICWDVKEKDNNAVVAQLKEKGTKVFGYTVDISEKENIVKAAELVRKEVGDVTIIINNAGIAPNGPFLKADETSLEKVFQVNVFSHFWILRQFLPKMIEKNHGHIVTTASLASYVPAREIAAYSSSKHAVAGFIDSLRQEMREHPKKPDIKFTTVHPLFVQTQMMDGIILRPRFDLGELLTPEYVGKSVVDGFRQNYEYLYLPPSSFIFALLYACLPFKINEKLQTGFFHMETERDPSISKGKRLPMKSK